MRTTLVLVMAALTLAGCTPSNSISAAAQAVPLTPHPTRLQRLLDLQAAADMTPLPPGHARYGGPGWPNTRGLARVLERDAVTVVDAALDDPDPRVREKALELLERFAGLPGFRDELLHAPMRHALEKAGPTQQGDILRNLALMRPPGRVPLDWIEGYVGQCPTCTAFDPAERQLRLYGMAFAVAQQLKLHGLDGRAMIERVQDTGATPELRAFAADVVAHMNNPNPYGW